MMNAASLRHQADQQRDGRGRALVDASESITGTVRPV